MSALTNPEYINLKTSFIVAMEKAIGDNKNIPIGQFDTKEASNSHLDRIKGWEQAVDIHKQICTSIEAAPEGETAPIAPSTPTVTEGEIVE